MELVDVYDENRQATGRTMERYGAHAPGSYRTVVHVCVFNSAGQLLIQKRVKEKRIWPERWDVTIGGGVDQGETSRQAAEREFREELGYPLDLMGFRPALTVNFEGGFDDFYLLVRDIDLAELTLQQEEVSAVRWATIPEILGMVDQGTFIPYNASFLRLLYDIRLGGDFFTTK